MLKDNQTLIPSLDGTLLILISNQTLETLWINPIEHGHDCDMTTNDIFTVFYSSNYVFFN